MLDAHTVVSRKVGQFVSQGVIGTIDDGVDIGGQARQVEASGHQAYTRGGAGIHREATKPMPIRAMASIGSPAISPQRPKGTPAASHWRATSRRNRSNAGGETVVAFAHLLAAAIAGEEELLQVIRADGEKIDPRQQCRQLEIQVTELPA